MLHIVLGAVILVGVVWHVAGLWLTSPPDVVDALLLRSPTPFSIYGVVALWALMLAACAMALQRKMHATRARALHTMLVALAAGGTVAHVVLIDGTLGTVSKIALSLALLLALGTGLWRLKIWRRL